MRIVCQKCSAAYAIDDKFVTAKGVRAQCPRCRTLQLVKKDDAGAAAAASPASPFALDAPPPPPKPAAAPASGGFDFGQLAAAPAPAAKASAPPAPFAFDFSAPPPPGPGAGGFAPPPPAPAGAAMPFDFGAPPPPPGSSKPSTSGVFAAPGPAGFSSSPSNAGGSPFDFGAPPPTGPMSIPPPAPSAPAFGAPAASDIKCRSCGKALSDPFDQALGTCDDCRSKQTENIGAPPPDTDAGRVERVDTSAIVARMTSPKPSVTLPPSASSPSSASSAAELSSVRTARRSGAPVEGRGKLIAMVVLGLAVVGGGGAFLATNKPWEKKRPTLVVKSPTPAALKKPVEAVVQTWRMNYPELDGAAAKQADGYVSNGEDLLSRDTTSAYLEAEEEFQKALVVDSSNDRAIAGWVLALAFGRGGQVDDQTAKAAESMLSGAEQRSGTPRLYVAHAHFLIARNGNTNDIQVLAERGKNSPSNGDKALAAMALGQSMLGKNEALAGQAFAEALRLDPKLKRGYFFQARLSASAGRYKEAADSLEKRLELDADQWEAAEELARLYVDVGEVPKAKKVLEAAVKAAPRNARARIGLATLGYQHAGEAGAAIEALSSLVQNKDLAKRDLSDAYVHLSGAYRVAGDAQKSAEAADQALELNPESVPAKLQHFFSMMEKNVTSQARIDLDAIKGKLNDPQIDNLLEGRLLVALGRYDEAATLLSKVHEADARRADALLLAGAAAARAKQDGRAWEFCLKRGVRLDPLATPGGAMSPLFFRAADVLRPATGAYASLNPGGDEDPNPELCEGLVAWFSDDLLSADRRFARVNAIDAKNAEAFAYRGLIALRRKDPAGAVKFGSRAVGASRTNGLAHYTSAVALLASGKVDAAKPQATQAGQLAAWISAPRVVIADIEARQKNLDEARRLLTTVLLSDPSYREAKRVLYKHAL
ncbi:MAG: zinc-ribbon domain-containing protein [Archangium sp.]|nr:zinc-ribbon domain-containing protein [Archangium sp.]